MPWYASPSMVVRGISVHSAEEPGSKLVVADIDSAVRDDHAMQELMSRRPVGRDCGEVEWQPKNLPLRYPLKRSFLVKKY